MSTFIRVEFLIHQQVAHEEGKTDIFFLGNQDLRTFGFAPPPSSLEPLAPPSSRSAALRMTTARRGQETRLCWRQFSPNDMKSTALSHPKYVRTPEHQNWPSRLTSYETKPLHRFRSCVITD